MTKSYSKIIRKSITALALATLLSANVAPVAFADPIKVSDYSIVTPDKSVVEVEGYITGALVSKGNAYDNNAVTNLALGATPNAPADQTIPVQLPKGDVRTNFNVLDNPSLIGKYVRVTGTGETYMSRTGIKSTTNIVVLDNTTPPSPSSPAKTEPVEQPQEVAPSLPSDTTPLATVRQGQIGSQYTVYGKIISVVSGWGGNGFYLQDDSGAGLYVYPGSALGYKEGDNVQLTGTLSTYNGELQLGKVSKHNLLSIDLKTATTETSITGLASAPEQTLVKLNNLVVGSIDSDNYNNSTFTATDSEGHTVSVKLDSRTGIKTSSLLEVIDKGDTINLTGILASANGAPQIRPFALNHFEVVKKAAPDTTTGEALTVGQIQGASHKSSYANRKVTVKEVVVTYVASDNNFYVQDINPDTDKKTSDGINVYSGKLNPDVKVGDKLTITGTVQEYFGSGYNERKSTDLTITQIVASAIEKAGTADVPAPLVLGKDRIFPADVIDNDGFAKFDPEEDALDFWESLEGMVVAVDDAKIIGPMKNKEIYVLSGNSTTPTNNVGGVTLRADAHNTDIIPVLLKSGKGTYKSGDFFTGRLYGPVTYSYTNYKVYVDDSTLPVKTDGGITPEVTNLVPAEDKLSIASYNIENFSANRSSTSDEKVQRIAKSFVSDLHSPDIIGLIEVQDNDGATDSGNTDATESANRLIKAIEALGGPSYLYTDIAPENNRDGGASGGNIRLGYLYNPERVSLSTKPKGNATEAVSWANGELSHSVGRIDPTNSTWESVRKTLAAEFIFKGEKVIVLANHLNSKRGDNGNYGSIQPVTLASEAKRHALANIIADFTQTGLSQNPKANIVMLGDFNDYEFTKTIQLLEAGGMTNLVSLHELGDRFSYFYNGNNQSLDNMLVSGNLLSRYSFDMVHVNSAFMEEHGRASDHDPLLLHLDFTKVKEAATETTTPEVTTEAPAPNKDNKGDGNNKTKDSNNGNENGNNKTKEKNGKNKTLPKTGENGVLLFSSFGLIILSLTFKAIFKHRND